MNTPQRKLQLSRHSCDSPSLCSVTKHTYRRKKPVYIVHKVCQSTRPHAFSQSHLPIERHTSAHAHTRAQTHACTDTRRERIIFSSCCNASESLNRNCQQGKSSILQLCPQRDSGNCRNFLDSFLIVALVAKTAWPFGYEEMRQSQVLFYNVAPPESL